MEHESQLRILYLYQILLKYSDEDHPLSTNEIMQMMEEKHQIKMHRTTVPKDISVLNDCGLTVEQVRSRDKKYFLNERTFEIPELKLLIDAVESSRFISDRKSRELIKKLMSIASDEDAEKLKRNIYTTGKVKTTNKKVMYIIDAINDAINTGRQISFKYVEYNAQKEQVLRNSGKPYVISPYSLIWNGDYYYVVGYCHTRDHIESFRIDRIKSQPKILDKAVMPMPDDFDISEYASEVFRMYDTEKPVPVTLLCKNELMKYVIDQFGIDVDTQSVDEDHFEAHVNVCTSYTFYALVFGMHGEMQITDPPEVQQEYKKMVGQAFRNL